MEEKLYISDEALEKYGYAYFKDMTADDYKYEADSSYQKLEDGLILTRDDMYNIYLSANEEDEGFNDIDDIKNIIYIDSHINVFNMSEICKRAGIADSTYRNWKAKGYKGMSDRSIEKIVKEMKRVCE